MPLWKKTQIFLQVKMTHHLSRRILTQVSKSVKSKIGNLDKPQSHEQRSVHIKGWHRKHILNMLTSARKSCLGLKEYTVQHRGLLPSQQPNTEKQISAACSKKPPVGDSTHTTENCCQEDKAGSVEISPIRFPASPSVPLSNITKYGWP